MATVPGVPAILGMITGHCAPRDILATICRYLRHQDGPAVACFVLREQAWVLAAGGPPAELAGQDPAAISAALFADGYGAAVQSFAHGWVRHLHSGAGEFLGMLVGF